MAMREPEFWTAETTGARALRTLLTPLGALYGASVEWKRHSAKPFRPHAKVLCVGNITVGGTGKTPIALELARMLEEERGCKIAFLTRGYGGKLAGPVLADPCWHTAADVGDEPLLLASVARTIVSRDRAQGAVLADRNKIDTIVMDDGFQNFDIVKDASIVVVDSETGFGNGHMVPAGPLRESVAGLDRADVIILMGDGHAILPHTKTPIMRARLEPRDPFAIKDRNLVAFAGIGRPEKFFDMLRGTGARVFGSYAFADHHVYSDNELKQLRVVARQQKAELVTTEKDFYRLPLHERDGITPIRVHVAFDDAVGVKALLDKVMPDFEEPMR